MTKVIIFRYFLEQDFTYMDTDINRSFAEGKDTHFVFFWDRGIFSRGLKNRN